VPIAQEQTASPVKFVVRYWSSQLPSDYREQGGQPRWLDYSVHPASKLGLHNAMLVVHDRLEILAAHGGSFACALFVVQGESAEMLAQEAANRLFAALPRGDVKWLDILPFLPLVPLLPLPAATDPLAMAAAGGLPQAQQLSLFAHQHTPYDDLVEHPHALDIAV
jgi:hypothetical protein